MDLGRHEREVGLCCSSLAFRDQLLEVGVLGALVLALGVTAWLPRLKEREPEEGDRTPRDQSGGQVLTPPENR